MDLQEKARRKLHETLGLPPQDVGMDGNELLDLPHPMMRFKIKSDLELVPGTLLRKAK